MINDNTFLNFQETLYKQSACSKRKYCDKKVFFVQHQCQVPSSLGRRVCTQGTAHPIWRSPLDAPERETSVPTQIHIASLLFPTSALPACWRKRQRQVQVPGRLHRKNLNGARWGCSDSEIKCFSRNQITCWAGENRKFHISDLK